jgi:general secretion pathway protein G
LLQQLRTRRNARRRAAFTLLEVLIVVAILVILASAASISLFRYLEDAKVGKAKTEMNAVLGVVKKYYAEKGEWPPNGGLAATCGPMMEGNPQLLDPWNQPYQLEVRGETQSDGTTNQRPFIISTGPTTVGKPAIQVPEK